ncbi:MAG: phage major capsid protein, partial [Novosphingobium sp.]
TVRSIGAASYKKPVNLGGAASGWVGETETRPATDTPKLSVLDFPAMELYAQPFATQTLLDDSSVDIAAWLADEVNIEFAEQEGAAFLGCDGVKQPRGLLRYDVVDNATWSWGKVGYVGTGASSAWPGSNPADKLLDLIYGLKSGYRNNASFLMNSLLVSDIRKFKDQEGNYLWQPSLQAGQPSTLLGYAVHDDDNMPVKAASSLSVAFGDFKRAYLIVDRVGIRVLRDPFTNKPYVGFYTTKRVGGGIQNFEAVKLLRFA